MERQRVVLDANVLYPFTLRDTLLRCAAAGLCQVYWSPTILDEATRNLVADGRMSRPQAVRLTSAMADAFPEALVLGHEGHLDGLSNDPKDRHVVAAALQAAATRIVTFNLKDFDPVPSGLSAVHPDAFLVELAQRAPATILALLQTQAAALRRPAVTREQLLVGLGRSVPDFESVVRALWADP